jgi:nitroreductase
MSYTEIESVKHPDTDYPIHKLIQKRWSPRAFSDDSVSTDLLNQLFEAARWAPSSYNEQPWKFIVARQEDEQAFEKLAQVMNDFNQDWASEAPVLVLALAKTTFDLDGRRNQHGEHDLGQAIAHLTFEATRNELYVHQMAGIHPDKAEELYDIPDNYKPMTMFAIGYKGTPDSLSDKLKKQETSPRSRKPLDEIVLQG